MTRLILPVAALLTAFLVIVPPSFGQNPEGVGVVVDIDWPSQPNHRRFNVANGDIVTGRFGYYKPPKYLNLPIVTDTNNVIIITKPINHARAYIMFDAIDTDPEFMKKKLGNLEGEIRDVGTNEWALQLGDQVHIQTEDLHGMTKVNLTIIRCGERFPIAQYSFINHLTFPRPPDDPAAPYIPYVSQMQ